ncbi:FxsB family cyclophane-forming radical SAM/SPASM peptide maturase [Streptomyces sp. NBC_00572]|uniref:FxsB family cyclophane-forming radical SAM/SPASM peptide maturase n=1 Tax=Streptomyces sp. NBC_00572 TaxID=2903664 RepID=UPI00224F72C9|nr:FxsB family cyclophane-forming radical SAM/SPASM peptide maturase [Streptomyces sp. NBC_00572]MCX4985355.1 FxsB family radical SAM/SPASM domain protein [Streptomyces sp. NBC_00572]
MPSFIDQYVLKVHGACDLACDHCYVYEHADQSWRTKPRTMSPTVAEQVAKRIAEHVERHAVPTVRLTLHGGEPLLLGVERLHELIRTFRTVLDGVVQLGLHIQTNGVTLNKTFLDLFAAWGVQVGVSLDGDRAANDRHRRYANGRSSHPAVLRGLALLRRREFRHLYGGILCTVDVENDPIAVYEALLEQAPPHLDFLLPQATWAHPPPRPSGAPAPYADWLGRIHARWIADGRPVPIRLFDALTAAAWGGPSGSEAVGLRPVALAVVDTDGSWEQADSLKTAYDGAPATGMSVFTHSVDHVAAHPGVAARNQGYADLCATCLACPVVRVCGGGLYAHRFRPGNGFDNPSVYCADLKRLASEIPAARMRGIAVPHDAGPRTSASASAAPDPAPPPVHQLPEGAFDGFAEGAGTVQGTQALADMQLSLTRALVAGLDPGDGGTSDLAAAAALGWQLLVELDGSHPAETAEVLRHPFVRTWARAQALRSEAPAGAGHGPPADAGDGARDLAHLAGVAAAAAWRAGVPTRLLLPVRDGRAHLPGLGAVRVEQAGTTAEVSVGGTDRLPHRWIGVRRLTTPRLPVALDDLDPYRAPPTDDIAGHAATAHPTAVDRLSPRQWTAWQVALSRAGRELNLLVPDYAAPLRTAIRAVVPLQPLPGDRQARALHRRPSFGAAGLAMPTGTTDVAAALLQEFQGAKLDALMDAYVFFGNGAPAFLSVPWQTAPVPQEQALHGLYGQVALAELWRARAVGPPRREPPTGATQGKTFRGRDRMLSARAAAVFRRRLAWADAAVDALAAEAAPAPAGARFVAGLRTAIDRLSADQVPTTAVPRRTATARRAGSSA